ncbi:MAG: hypothetical protein H6887_10535 [Hoeflea sp.]|nr:hypothetical protein [Hoeflea sp.]
MAIIAEGLGGLAAPSFSAFINFQKLSLHYLPKAIALDTVNDEAGSQRMLVIHRRIMFEPATDKHLAGFIVATHQTRVC